MKKNVAFTICAKNYIGLAQILEQSVRVHNPGVDFFIFVADEFSLTEKADLLPPNVIVAKEHIGLPESLWKQMAFQYNLTEFCTAIKPYCFKWLMAEKDYDGFIYFDPDIYVFNSLDYIYSNLNQYSIIVTPHILNIETNYTGEILEKGVLFSGIFNLGFLALRRGEAASKMLDWWGNRLIDKCFAEALDSYFFDQRWMDFLPGFFDAKTLLISRNIGLNVAPWNFFERKIITKDNQLFVTNRNSSEHEIEKLIFVHYSGYDYSELKKGNVVQKNIRALKDYEDIRIITNKYRDEIYKEQDVFDRFIQLQYTYNYFEDGTPILLFHRRLYFSLLQNNVKYEDPFLTTKNSLFQLYRKKKIVLKEGKKSVDKITRHDMGGFKRELYYVNAFTKFLFRIIGCRKYIMFLRLIRFYSRYEVQIHLLDNKFNKDNLY